MESMFALTVLFSAGAIALLAVFLVASEKELKKKRFEIDQLLVKLGDSHVTDGAPAADGMAASADSEELDRLRARNQELEKELESMSSNPESNQRVAEELERAQRDVEIANSNAQWLQNANDELKAEIEELNKRLRESSMPANDAIMKSAGASDRERALESEIADLQQQLAESRSEIRELGGMEQKLSHVDAIEANHREEQKNLRAKIAELEGELSAAANMMEEIDSLRQRLAESERIQHTLRDERHGFDQEIAYWKARVAEAEVNSRRLAALQEPFKQLLAKQASLEERHREYQEALANFSQLVAMPNVNAQPSATFDEFQAAVPVIEMRDGAVENQAPESVPAVVTLKNVVATQGAQKPKRQFGVIPAVIVLAFAGALAAGLWSMKATDTPEPAPVTAGALPARNQNQAPVSIATTPAPDVTEPPVTPHIPAAKAPTPTAVK